MELLVVVPTYNEIDNLPPLVDHLEGLGLDLSILVVDDASPDGTGRWVQARAKDDPRLQVLHRQGKLGLGSAYVAGFSHALAHTGASLIAQMDADFSHDPQSLPALVAAARRGAVAIGSRYVPGGGTRNWGLARRLISRWGSLYARSILGMAVHDLTGGYKCWPRAALAAIDLAAVKSNGYGFQVEMSYRAHRLGFAIEEVPIVFEDRRVGQSKMSAAIALEAMVMVWRLRLGRL